MAHTNGQVKEKVGDFIARRLREWGVERIYGYAGDGVNGIIGGIQRAGNQPRLIQPPHEELAALMACAHAKYTGQVGVCLGTSGPGAIHLLNGLYDAASDHQPVVAIVGQQSQTAIAATISRTSICRTCSRTSPAPSSRPPVTLLRCAT